MTHRSKEEQILQKRFLDLSRMAYQRGIPFFSEFIGIQEREFVRKAAAMQHPTLQESLLPISFYGGYAEADRTVACFLPEAGFPIPPEKEFPLCCVRITPSNRRFSEDLTHRDYLGTVMGIGLERDQIGDIVVRAEGSDQIKTAVGYLFCKSNKKDLLLDITRIRHTTVTAQEVDATELHWVPEYKDISGSVSSLRLDAVLSVAIRTSRSQGLQLIRDGNICINGRCCTENAKILQDGDILSVRGYGKYLIQYSGSKTRKGRYQITAKQYI